MQYGQPESSLNINQFHKYAMDVVEAVCGIFTMPIEIILRPQYGTRYFPVPIFFFSSLLMLFLPLFSSAADSVTHMISSGATRAGAGLFGIGSLCSLYFFLTFLHAFRLWSRMIYMQL